MITNRQRLAAAFILALIPALLLWRAIALGECLLPADLLRDIAPWATGGPENRIPWNPLMWDGIAQFYPWRLFAANTLRSGFIPLWNPHQFCGTPFIANSQSAVFYPLNLLFVLLPVAKAFGASAWLHLSLTGLFCYLFLTSRIVGRSHPAALLGAIVWQTSTWQVSWLALPTFLCVSAWLPLALILIDKLIEKRTALQAAALGACLGVMLLAGHLQIALYCLMLITGYGIFRLVIVVAGGAAPKSTHLNPPLEQGGGKINPQMGLEGNLLSPSCSKEGLGEVPKRPESEFPAPPPYEGGGWGEVLIPIFRLSLLAVLIMFGLAAPQLLPSVELSRMSHRTISHLDWASYQGYVKLATPWINLATLTVPNFFGNPSNGSSWGLTNYAENACFIGVLPLMLLLIAVTATWRSDKSTRFFAITAAVSLLMALGTWLDALPYFAIPGFAQTGSPGRILVLWTFCGAVLAARGADALLQAKSPARLLKTGFSLLGVFAAATISYACWWISRSSGPGVLQGNLAASGDLWRLPACILLVTATIGWLLSRKRASSTICSGLMVTAAALEMLMTGMAYNHTVPADQVYPVTPGIAYLRQHAGSERVMPLNRSWSIRADRAPRAVLPPNAGIVYGLLDTQGYDSLQTRQYMEFAGRMNGDGHAAPQENGNMTFTHGPYSPLSDLAAARYIATLTPLETSGTGLNPVFQDGTMLIYENTRALPRFHATAEGTIIEATSPSPAHLQIKMTYLPVGDNNLVVADQWYPGWRSFVNGQERPVEEGPEIYRTVHLNGSDAREPGSVMVEMKYQPTSFQTGLYFLCLALAGTIFILTKTLASRRPAAPAAKGSKGS